jgi:hypothetical protein
MLIELTSRIERITYTNEENGFSMAKLSHLQVSQYTKVNLEMAN